jgi:DNA-binding transcriptional LysR family regulator
MLDPRRLLTLRAVAVAGSFSRAAEALALTQPAVSQQVAALERQLATKLLERGPGGPVPTEAGRVLLAHAEAIAGRLELADRQLGELLERAVRLRIGAFSSALGVLVPPAIARLRHALPDIELAAVEGGSDDLGRRVGRGELHVAVCFQDPTQPRREPDGCARRDLGDEPMLAALPPGHKLAGRRSVRLADLAGDVWTAPSASGIVARACAEAGFEPQIAFTTPDPLAIGALVAGGLAVTLVPRLLAAELRGAAVVPLAGEPPRRSLYTLTGASGAPATADAFVEAVAAELDARPPAGAASSAPIRASSGPPTA